ncbi:hypothetical protein [Streptomyces sp. NPDC051211]|uniref:hypothetical protein n=1 Tax=Streptomyces sp. NPDC051211 TaxID=3154643 RepID=UPI00344B2106
MSDIAQERPPAELTEGVVELRKRGGAAGRPVGQGVADDCLESMARRAAERAGHPRAIGSPG